MPDWGVQPTGFIRPTMAELRADRVAAFRALFGDNQPTEPGSINGRIIDYVVEPMHLLFEVAEGNYNAKYLSTAGVNAIDLKAEEFGFTRAAATSSTVTLTCSGTAGTVINSLSQVRLNDSLEVWQTLTGGIIGGGGTVAIEFVAVNTGPIAATAGSAWTIITPIAGWTSVTNSADASLGRDQQTAAELRAEIRRSLRGSLLKKALLRVDGVVSATVFENDTDVPDAVYSATHWAEAMVVGGLEQDIVNTIALHLAPGISTFGTDSGVETITGLGETIAYSRPQDTNVYIEIDITGGEGFAPVDPAALETYIEEQIAIWGDANHDPGDDVAPVEIAAATLDLLVGKVTLAIRVDTVDPPVATGILAIGDRFQAAFDSTRVSVNIL